MHRKDAVQKDDNQSYKERRNQQNSWKLRKPLASMSSIIFLNIKEFVIQQKIEDKLNNTNIYIFDGFLFHNQSVENGIKTRRQSLFFFNFKMG